MEMRPSCSIKGLEFVGSSFMIGPDEV
jgi:hypothetical protein